MGEGVRSCPRAGLIGHVRFDYPDRDDKNWMKHTQPWLDTNTGKVTIDYRPVHTYTLTNDVAYVEPKARVY
jgi:succinate dehydrogenase / fumarate reductase flavoprotein subunit